MSERERRKQNLKTLKPNTATNPEAQEVGEVKVSEALGKNDLFDPQACPGPTDWGVLFGV